MFTTSSTDKFAYDYSGSSIYKVTLLIPPLDALVGTKMDEGIQVDI